MRSHRRLLSVELMLLAHLALPWRPAAAAPAPKCPRVEYTFVRKTATADTRAVRDGRGATVLVDRHPIIQLSDIRTARLDEYGSILLTYWPEASARLTRETTGHSGSRYAFVVDDRAILVITWEGEFGFTDEGSQLSLKDRRYARSLVKTINACIADAPTR